MDLQTLKQRLSLQNIYQSVQRVLTRFPVAVCFLVCLTVLFSYMVITENEPGRYLLCLISFLCGGTLISMTASLWGEEQADKRKRWIAETASLAVYGIYCVLLFLTDIIPNRGLPAFWLGNVAWMTAVLVLIPFAPFLQEKDDLKSWHFILSLCGALIISAIVSWVMTGGLEGLVLGTAALFDFDPNKKLCAIIMIVCIVLLWGILFLALIPAGERKHNNAAEMPSFLTKVVSWLLIPLLCCYIVVLYVYGITILVHWELPKGTISWLVSAVMFGAMHGNTTQIIFAFLLGLIFGYVDCKTNSIVPSVVIHFINNFYAVSTDIINQNGIFDSDTVTALNIGMIIMFLILGVLSYVYLAKRDNKVFKVTDKPSGGAKSELTLKEKFVACFTTPGIIVSLSFFIFEMLMNLIPEEALENALMNALG